MCLRCAWCDTLPAAKRASSCGRSTPQRVAASRTPHALWIAVSAAVIEFVMVKREVKDMLRILSGKRRWEANILSHCPLPSATARTSSPVTPRSESRETVRAWIGTSNPTKMVGLMEESVQDEQKPLHLSTHRDFRLRIGDA